MGEELSEETDEEIARLVQSGDFELFALLIKRYEKKISRYARKFLSQSVDIEDVLQEIFIKAYRNIRSFDSKRKFSSWIYRIAHNELVNALKKQKKKRFLFFDLDVFLPYLRIEESFSDKGTITKTLNGCLDKLDPKYREPIILYYLERLGYKEIADVLQIPISTVAIRLKRGKEKLKTIYNKMGYKIHE